MESKDELKEIDIKNCMCHYFDDIMRVSDTNNNSIDILSDEKIQKHFNLWNFIKNFNRCKTIAY